MHIATPYDTRTEQILKVSISPAALMNERPVKLHVSSPPGLLKDRYILMPAANSEDQRAPKQAGPSSRSR